MIAMSDTQRMILRRMDVRADPSEAAASLVEADPDLTLIDRGSASSLLVEGAPEAINHLVGELSGWSAFPMKTYPQPTTRPKVLRPPDE